MMQRVTWLNLHVGIPLRDVRKLIYSLLDACDRECIEMAHGVRRIISQHAACIGASQGHLKLVRFLSMSATPWNAGEIAHASLQSYNQRMIEWACTQAVLSWPVREQVILTCLQKGFFDLSWRLHVKRQYHFPSSTYHWCAIYFNLEFALKVHKRYSKLLVVHEDTLIDTIILCADVRFFRWAVLVKKVRVSAAQLERAVEKWPELGRQKRIKL